MYSETRIPSLRAALWASTPEPVLSSPSAEASSSDAAAVSAPSLIVPDGCMDLIVIDSEVVIAGADSTARTFAGASTRGAPAPIVGLRFDPGVLPQLLATSAAELADRVTPLDAVIGRLTTGAGQVRSVADPVSASDGHSHTSRLLAVAETLASRVDIDLRPLELATLLGVRQDQQRSDIAEVAARFAYSPRQLRRLSAEWFGYGPKHLSKVLRWQAARALIDAGRTRTAAAAAAGYADAAHLWRDERSLLGR
ncbi:helix-turn-helix domain-containing protein [Brevibacterium marinum]|uniref:AraC-like DNA-binding protein n=1 Tax=Brevibacterium marinum TaxID=418643 RepID=A0A846RW57_9MICO|nr:helix-turn-helix domain-containing protein [Brevibacterium marinum]NJC55138.1 AraC-like DNA-binding protein [Brevibacterium marinum]